MPTSMQNYGYKNWRLIVAFCLLTIPNTIIIDSFAKKFGYSNGNYVNDLKFDRIEISYHNAPLYQSVNIYSNQSFSCQQIVSRNQSALNVLADALALRIPEGEICNKGGFAPFQTPLHTKGGSTSLQTSLHVKGGVETFQTGAKRSLSICHKCQLGQENIMSIIVLNILIMILGGLWIERG